MVEAACNPLVVSLFPDNKTTMLNRFHVWFPGGIVIGGLIAYLFFRKNADRLACAGSLVADTGRYIWCIVPEA
jgi:fucose permease